MNFDVDCVEFKPLEITDLPLLHRWLNDPYILSVWSPKSKPSLEEVEKKYIPRIRTEIPVRSFLVKYDKKPIGLIQSYTWRDFAKDAVYLRNKELSSGSLDFFIGEVSFRHVGFGPEIIRLFLDRLFFSIHDVNSCLITPHEDNVIALKAYEKAGFRKIRVDYDPKEPWSPIVLMRIEKGDLRI